MTTVIPDNERWLHQLKLQNALPWAQNNPTADTSIDSLLEI